MDTVNELAAASKKTRCIVLLGKIAARSPSLTAAILAFLILACIAGATLLIMHLSKAARLTASLASAVSSAEQALRAPAPDPGNAPDEAGGPCPVAFEDPLKEKEARDLSLRKIKEAETLYRLAIKCYERGDGAQAAALYERSFATLGGALTADDYYRTKNDFSLLFYKLNKTAGQKTARDGNRRPIPLSRENELARKYMKIYTEGGAREKVLRALERSGRYRTMILSVLRENGLPEELVYLPILESLYDENDLSSAGALGLWQLMPDRARLLGLRVNFWIDERKDPEKSTRAAARYLKQLFTMFDDWHLALAAYNRGENGLGRDLAFSNAIDIDTLCEQRTLPLETQNYVPQFIVCALIGRNPEKFGFHPVYETPPPVDEVTVNTPIDLSVAARCAGTTPENIRKLNPALRAWCTPPNYPRFKLRLPAGTKENFAAAIAREKDLMPARPLVRYRVAKGDSLNSIARMFNTTPAAIKKDNRILRKRGCAVNQTLLIRPGR